MSGVALSELCAYTDQLLKAQSIKDYCPNGLQVEGKAQVLKIVGGVTASLALIDASIERDADILLVHHGYFWKGEASPIVGMKKTRIERLIGSQVSLLAYHLPLDVHPEFGNNAQLAKRLGFSETGPLDPFGKPSVGSVGELESPCSADELRQKISRSLGRECLMIGDSDTSIKRIAWCTGAAQSMIDLAVSQNVDAYISGEISEPTVHVAREMGVHYYSAGHHATERYGVQALGEHLAKQYPIEFEFVDIDNPV